jgi:phage-related protein
MKIDVTIVVNDCEIQVKGNYNNEDGLSIESAIGCVYACSQNNVTADAILDAVFDKLTDF